MQRDAARVRVRVAVRDERERGAAAADDGERGRERDRGERRAAAPRAAAKARSPGPLPPRAPAGVDRADELRVQRRARPRSEPPVDRRRAVERPSTRPSEMRPLGRAARQRARRRRPGRAAVPSARESTLVPPPGMNPTATSSSSPFTTSLKHAVPGEDVDPLAPPGASAASSVACPGRAVSTVSSGPAASSSRSTAATSSGVTREAHGLTISSAPTAPIVRDSRAREPQAGVE